MNWVSKYYIPLIILSSVLSEYDCLCNKMRRGTYPSYDRGDWPEECRFFLNPNSATYHLDLLVAPSPINPIFNAGIPDVNVTIKIIKVQRIPHPQIQDSCVWASFIDQTLTGLTDSRGIFERSFDFTYGSVGDYFILEISIEKDGYYPDLISSDERWYDYDKKIRSNDDTGILFGIRDLDFITEIKVQNDNP